MNAILICERVIRDADSGAISVIAITDTIFTSRLPVTLPSLLVFVKMTDAEGNYELTLEIVRRDDDEAIGEATRLNASADDPLGSTVVVVVVENVSFSRTGHYDFRLWINDRFADSTALLIGEVESSNGGADTHGRP